MASVQSGNSASEAFAALNAQAKGASSASASTSEEVQNRFLKLLVTQLKNQDPLNPLDNAAVTTQVSQISTVTGIEKLNTTLESLLGTYNETQAMQATGLIGKNVLVPGSRLALANGSAAGGVSLAGPADRVTVKVLDATGSIVQSQDLGARDAGSFSFVWDGRNDAGQIMPPGNYRFTVNAVRGSDKVSSEVLQLGTVSALVRREGGFALELAGIGRVDFAQVEQIL